MEGDKLYVQHVLEAIGKIEQFITGLSFEDFSKNKLVQSAVIRELGVIGEAAKKLSEEFKLSHGNTPWKQIVGMRDKLVHDYFEIDVEAIWETIKSDIISLKEELSNKENIN